MNLKFLISLFNIDFDNRKKECSLLLKFFFKFNVIEGCVFFMKFVFVFEVFG